MGGVFSKIAPKLGRRGLVIIVSDAMGDVGSIARALTQFRASKHEVLFFQIMDPDEIDFPFSGRIQFRDLENAANEHTVDARSLRDAYLDRLQQHESELKDACRRNRVDLIPLTTDRPFADALARVRRAAGADAMTLLNAMLALGALAFTVPLAIHLLFRSRFRTVDWGAMHLLDSVIRINRRRIQLLHLLLLLLRCLLPVLLAFCLARPVLTGFKSLPGDAPQSLVLAIDDSRSMTARDASGDQSHGSREAGVDRVAGGSFSSRRSDFDSVQRR